MLEKLQEILCELFDVEADEITGETDILDDLYADSLDVTELVMIIEEEFGLKITKKTDLTAYRKVGDIAKKIEESVKE
ncbi:MAG: acyl carrier protein [Clostridia bacterium]